MTYLTKGPFALDAFIVNLELVHKKAREIFPKLRAGFCFALYNRLGCHLVLKGIVGKVRDFKLPKYEQLVEEKASRLITRHDDHTSYQSRNEDSEKYGGAVRGKDCILSISGLATEHQDEAVALTLLVLMDQISAQEANDIAELTGNKLFEELLVAYRTPPLVSGRTGGER